MRLRLVHKFVGTLFIMLIVCCAAVLGVTICHMKKIVEAELEGGMARSQKVTEAAIAATAKRFLRSGDLVARNPDFAAAVAARDHAAVYALARDLMRAAGSDFMSVTDAQGTVVARGHAPKYGDNIARQSTVAKACGGQAAAAVVTGPINPFMLRASCPIRHEGAVVGTVSVGVKLTTPAFLDELKRLAGVEVTVFKGDTRVMTTIVRDGKRVVGTRLEAPDVAAAVLERGEVSLVHDCLLGVRYQSAYWPVRTADGKILGMWSTGIPIEELARAEWAGIRAAVLTAAGLLVALVALAMLLGLRICAPVGRITRYILAVAGGDASARLDVHGNDDMGQLADGLRTMVANLKAKIAEADESTRKAQEESERAASATAKAEAARAAAERARAEGMLQAANQLEGVVGTVSTDSEQLSAQVEQASRGAERQNARVGEIATAMEEMNATVMEVARNTAEAADSPRTAKTRAADGAGVVAQVVDGIGHLREQALGLKDEMTVLGQQAESIGQILGVISDIADQTNLLALNAAIEAARAGDAGRGFAVVADEVRKLAEKTMTATKQVGDAIHEIQSGTRKNVDNVDQVVEVVVSATELAGKSGEALTEIVSLVDATTQQVQSIATAAEEQSAASEEINHSIEDVSRISAETAEAMHHAAGSVSNLASQAQALRDLVAQMKRG